jgi:hypothetical protein
MKTNQTASDSQKEPLGPNQLKWVAEKYLRAFFRDGKCMTPHDHQPARSP